MKPTQYEIVAALKLARKKRSASNSLVNRIAAKHLYRLAATGYDHIARAFVLEGAAGKQPRTWANNSADRNLMKAAKELSEFPAIDPEWFTRKDTGCWRILEKQVRGVIKRYGLDQDSAMDILNSALMGFSPDGSQGKIPLWEAGKFAKDGILDGSESPKNICAGYAGKLFQRKAIDEANKMVRREKFHVRDKQDEDGNEFGYQDRADSREFDFGKAFLDILTDRSSRAGGMWRDAIRGAYAGTAQEAVGQSYWEYFFEMGEPPRKRSIAQETGKSEQLVGQHLKAIGKNIRSAIMSNSRLITVLEAEIRATYGAGAEISDRGVLMELFNPRAASTPPVHLRVFHILGI